MRVDNVMPYKLSIILMFTYFISFPQKSEIVPANLLGKWIKQYDINESGQKISLHVSIVDTVRFLSQNNYLQVAMGYTTTGKWTLNLSNKEIILTKLITSGYLDGPTKMGPFKDFRRVEKVTADTLIFIILNKTTKRKEVYLRTTN